MRGFHVGRWLKDKVGSAIKAQRLSGQRGTATQGEGGGPGHFLPALKSRDKAFEAAASGRHDHDILHAHSVCAQFASLPVSSFAVSALFVEKSQ